MMRAATNTEFGLSGELVREINREDELQPAVFQFNTNPRRGVTMLCEIFRVAETPKAVALIFHHCPGLLGSRIGEYLAKKENQEILSAYFLQLDLQFPFLQALRQALSSSLHLPGEGEQIDRVVQTWARCWVQQNPDCGMTGDQAYILAFASVLLNSDLHAPAVVKRMTPSQFIMNVRGAISEEELSDAFLTDIFNSLKADPFEFKREASEEFMALSSPRLRGVMAKKSKGWRSRWTLHFFVLAHSCLYYFKDCSEESGDNPLGMIQLVSLSVQPIGETRIEMKSSEGVLQYVKFRKRKPEIVKNIDTMYFEAQSTKIRDKWLYRIRTSCVFSNFTGDTGPEISPDLPTADESMGHTSGIEEEEKSCDFFAKDHGIADISDPTSGQESDGCGKPHAAVSLPNESEQQQQQEQLVEEIDDNLPKIEGIALSKGRSCEEVSGDGVYNSGMSSSRSEKAVDASKNRDCFIE
jgi:hypothetical protein